MAEPKPFSKSSMKSAPLARQREANEANGSISDTLIPRDYGELYNLNPHSSPSSPLLAGAVSVLTRLFLRVTLNFKLLVPIFPFNLASSPHRSVLIHSPMLICLSQAMTLYILTCNKAACKGRKKAVCERESEVGREKRSE